MAHPPTSDAVRAHPPFREAAGHASDAVHV